jgi:hypothetical protein
MVAEKINARGKGPMTQLTRQPTGGRRKEGGLRIGEMERDSLISHGIAGFIQESMMERSDKYRWQVCKRCGIIPNYSKKINSCICPLCENNESSIIETPYCMKLLNQEMEAMNLQMRFNCDYVNLPEFETIENDEDEIIHFDEEDIKEISLPQLKQIKKKEKKIIIKKDEDVKVKKEKKDKKVKKEKKENKDKKVKKGGEEQPDEEQPDEEQQPQEPQQEEQLEEEQSDEEQLEEEQLEEEPSEEEQSDEEQQPQEQQPQEQQPQEPQQEPQPQEPENKKKGGGNTENDDLVRIINI